MQAKAIQSPNRLRPLAAGEYEVTATADIEDQVYESDENNNDLTEIFTVTVDEEDPTVIITNPSTNETVNSASYQIGGTASDTGSGLEKVEVSIDGGVSWDDATGTDNWTYLATLALGANVVKAKATDNAGNESAPTAGVTLTLEVTATDPNEPGIPDGKDFMSIDLYKMVDNLKTEIRSYADMEFTQWFSYFFNTDAGYTSYLVRCWQDEFTISAASSPGLYDILIYEGIPTVSGNTYTLEFPWQTAFGSSETVELWLYSQESTDRLPDSGRITFKW